MSNAETAKVTIVNRLGLHARPAMVFVEVATKYKADVSVRRCDQNESVDGKSIMQLMMLAATQGTQIEISAKNDPDAKEAIRDLVALVRSKFQEE
ncbi:MAG: HPr family phosphocarrier protein [Phycisphaerales bacterium]|nr:HPr family phosphocarrier protein [Phycisphaerales bacterium]MCI0631020.1 HPr family phosphocarrier protein [Phycisphaerales bacterium]MCI0676225.1 HPr family phosphocarrier protein [Phycisphaerales bacterium]